MRFLRPTASSLQPPTVRLLIDGYNLLHATDLFGAGELAGTLRGSREALLGFLAERLTEKERRSAVIVFDARDAPAGLPDRFEHDGIDVRFARDHPDADALIEAILEDAKGTRGLTVVSGDRRVQRAARSRGAKPVDSSAWFDELCRRRAQASPAAEKPRGRVGENAEWIEEFSDADALAEIERDAAATPPPRSLPTPSPGPDKKQAPAKDSPPKKKRRRGEFPKPEASKEEFGKGIGNPFPPGYGEDVLD